MGIVLIVITSNRSESVITAITYIANCPDITLPNSDNLPTCSLKRYFCYSLTDHTTLLFQIHFQTNVIPRLIQPSQSYCHKSSSFSRDSPFTTKYWIVVLKHFFFSNICARKGKRCWDAGFYPRNLDNSLDGKLGII
jgi:hypothetical protein